MMHHLAPIRFLLPPASWGLLALLLLSACIAAPQAAAGSLLSLLATISGQERPGPAQTTEGERRVSKEIRLSLSFDDATGMEVLDGEIIADIVLPLGRGSPFALRVPRAEVSTPWLACSLEGRASGSVRSGAVAFEEIDLHLSQVRRRSQGQTHALPDVALSAKGSLHPGKERIELREMSLAVDKRRIARGSCTLSRDDGLRADLAAPLQAIYSLLREQMAGLPLRLAEERSHSSSQVLLELRAPRPEGSKPRPLSLRLRTLQRMELGFPGQDTGLSLPPSSLRLETSRAAAAEQAPGLKARFKAKGPLSLGPITLDELQLGLQGRLGNGGLQAEHGELRAEGGSLSSQGRSLPLPPLRLTASDMSLEKARQRIGRLKLEMDRIGELHGALRHGERLHLRLEGKDLELAGPLDLLKPLTAWDPGPWSPQGAWSLSAELSQGAASTRAKASLALEQLSFSSPAGNLLAQNVSPSLDLAVKRTSGLHLNASLHLSSGEALWGTRYFNFSKEPFTLKMSSTSAAEAAPGKTEIHGRWSDYGSLHLGGDPLLPRLESPWTGRISLEELQLPKLASMLGLAADVQLDGSASLSGRLAGDEKGVRLEGDLETSQVQAVSQAGGWEIRNASLRLPLSLRFGSPPGPRDVPGREIHRWGRFSPGDIRLQGQRIEVSPVSLALKPDALLVREPLAVSFPGGEATLGQVAVHKPLSSDFELQGRLKLEEIDLGALSRKALPLQGRVQGDLPLVRLNRRELATKGTLKGSLFGGELAVTDLAAVRPLASSREYGATIRVRKMDLERVSRALDVGRITGLLDLEVENLRMAYGQPVHFSVRAESIPTDEVSQRISLKAVNTLSILGTGSGLSGIGIQFYANFFREFPYERIGMACTLTNDVFSLQGLIHEDGLEYLVKRSLFGINVVNTRPRNRIAFSDMLRRLERIGAQPGTPKSGTPGSDASP